jgi:hypothetical protein
MSNEVRTVWQGSALLGEGPVWDAAAQMLWFVDIKQHRVYRLDPATEAVETWDAPAQIGWVMPAGGKLIAGLQSGLATFDPDTGVFSALAEVEPHLPGNRLNDATVAADGTIWFGSMDDGCEQPTGRLHRFDGTKVTTTALPAIPITNGPAFSPDGDTLYHVDTAAGVVHKVAIDADGEPGARDLGGLVRALLCTRRHAAARGAVSLRERHEGRVGRAGLEDRLRHDRAGRPDRGGTGGAARGGESVHVRRRGARPRNAGRAVGGPIIVVPAQAGIFRFGPDGLSRKTPRLRWVTGSTGQACVARTTGFDPHSA